MRVAILNLNPGIDRVIYLDHPIRSGEMNRAAKTVTTAGSKAANQAKIFSLLGDEVDIYSFTGGPFGEECDRLTVGEGIHLHHVRTAAGVRVNTKVIDRDGVCTEFNEPGGPVTERELKYLETALSVGCCEKVDVLSICGSIPQGVDKRFYLKLIGEMKRMRTPAGKKLTIALDSSGDALAWGFLGFPNVIKPNLGELADMVSFYKFPIDLSTEEEIYTACGKFSAKKVDILCTMDAGGSLAVSPEGSYRVSTPTVPFRSFSGAGDTYLAAYLHAKIAEEKSFPEALRFASAAAAARVSLPGTELPTKNDINTLTQQVTVTPIN